MKRSFYVMKCLVVVVALVALCLGAAPVKADPITYQFFGLATGTLFASDGETPLIDFASQSQFQISIVGNTADPFMVSPGTWVNAGPAPTLPGLTGSFTILDSITNATLLTGTFTNPLYVFCFQGDFSDIDNIIRPQVGFGDLLSGDLLSLAPSPSLGLDKYDLKSLFGPTVVAGCEVSQFFTDVTIDGLSVNFFLSFDSADAAFRAVPLPGGVLLLGAGLLRLIRYRRSRKI